MIKYIHIDYRKPRNKEEKECFAISNVDSNTTNMFVNVVKNQKGRTLSDTFFHEMVHVFLAFHGKDKQMTDYQEERLAERIGKLCAEALK